MTYLKITFAAALTLLVLAPAGASAGPVAGPLEYGVTTEYAGPHSEATELDACSIDDPVTGGGAAIAAPKGIADGDLDTALTSSAPYDGAADLDLYPDEGFRAAASNGSGEVRELTVTAICFDDDSVPSYVKNAYIQTSTTFSQAVECSEEKLIGGGGYVEGPYTAGSALIRSHPFDDDDANSLADDGWGYSAQRGAGGTVDIAAYAVCLEKGTHAIRYARKVETAGGAAKVGGGVTGKSKVSCPRGFHASGGGVFGDLRIRTSAPFDSGDKDVAPDDGWKAKYYSPGGSDEKVKVHVVCLR
jgi:hypothetical protein